MCKKEQGFYLGIEDVLDELQEEDLNDELSPDVAGWCQCCSTLSDEVEDDEDEQLPILHGDVRELNFND